MKKVEEQTEEVEEKIDLSKEEFLEKIKEYSLLSKAVEYSFIVYQIRDDSIDVENETMLLTYDEIASRFLELSSQIGKDSFGLALIKYNNDKEENIIKLMQLWFDKMEKSYDYLASYYWDEEAIYEIKSDELLEEAEKIKDECTKAIEEYMKE